MQLGLEVVAIGISNITVFVWAGHASINIGSKYLPLLRANQQLRVDGILMPHLLQSPNVGGNLYTKTLTL